MINKLTESETPIDTYVADEDGIEGASGGFFGLLDRTSSTDPNKARIFEVIFFSGS